MRVRMLFAVLIFSVSAVRSQIFIPQLQAGVSVNDTIHSFTYSIAGYCSTLPAYDVDISMDSALTPMVSGIELFYVVSQLTTPPGVVFSSQWGVINIGDTLMFQAPPNNHHTLFSSAAGTITLNLIISGTPVVPFEVYPCELVTLCTLSDCNNSCFTVEGSQPGCTVDTFINTPGHDKEPAVSVFPNPASSFIQVLFNATNRNHSHLFLYDFKGALVATHIFQVNHNSHLIPVDHLESGPYFWRITGNEGTVVHRGSVVIGNN